MIFSHFIASARFKTSKYFYVVLFVTLGSEVNFLRQIAAFTLSAHDFVYPKILFHVFEEERLLFQSKQVVLAKFMYRKAF